MSSSSTSLVVHALVLGLATGSASYVWLRDKAPAASVRRDVVVWHGRSADVSRIELAKPTRHVVLEGKADATGRYYIGTDDSRGTSPSPAEPPAKPVVTFVSVGPAQKIAEKLGELRAARDLGAIDDAKAAELGLVSPDTRLTVTLRGEEHVLEVGMSAPGDTDRYVRDAKTRFVFVVDAEPFRDLEAGEHTLVEKDLHEFPLDPDVDRVTVVHGGKRRTLVRRGTAQKRFFADPQAPETNDETATTWMAKVERLKAMDFITGEPPSQTGDKLRLEYEKNRGSLGFLEVVKSAPIAGTEGDVFIRTERTRLWAKVSKALGDQVLGDVGSIVK
jgi:hypothetical protein